MKPLLEFDQVSLVEQEEMSAGLQNVSFSLSAGELILIRLERTGQQSSLVDLSLGLLDPTRGEVRLDGVSWHRMNPQQATINRSRAGVVLEAGGGWLERWTVEENVVLSQRHHTSRSIEEIRDEAAELARRFSLPGIPQALPGATNPVDLRRAACIRAFLGTPELILLERPVSGNYSEIMPGLMHCINRARKRGAGILWISDSEEVWSDNGVRPSRRYALSGPYLNPMEA
jgi:phospholipid/cholesterol/gamma-HCH transport system ATP-binding protein